MAVMLKSRQEIAQLREAGRIVAQTYEVLRPSVKPGISTTELDKIADRAVSRIDAVVVGNVVAVILARRGLERHQP